MKILYAASKRKGAYFQLFRFLNAIENKPFTLKIAAHQKTTPNVSIDWNLDALQNIFDLDHISFDNDNLQIYYDQIKYFNPDLIISDLEPFTSHIAFLLNKKIWQVSPSLLYYATSHKKKIQLGIYKYYKFIFEKNLRYQQRIKNMIINSDKNYVYSHLGDSNFINLPDNFEWVRPFYLTGKNSKTCYHNLVAATLNNDKKLFNFIKKYDDAVAFTTFTDEQYNDIIIKNICDSIEYGCNVKNCNLFVSAGHTDILADAYYNNKFTLILPDFKETECIINSLYAENFKLGKVIYDYKALDFQPPVNQTISINRNIKSLVEKIEEL